MYGPQCCLASDLPAAVLVVLVAVVVFVPIVVPGVRSLLLVSPLPLLARDCPHSKVE